jgi:hypothetical protein
MLASQDPSGLNVLLLRKLSSLFKSGTGSALGGASRSNRNTER